jgi:hypothetical protein
MALSSLTPVLIMRGAKPPVPRTRPWHTQKHITVSLTMGNCCGVNILELLLDVAGMHIRFV